MTPLTLTATGTAGTVILDPLDGTASATGAGGSTVWTGTLFPALAVVAGGRTDLLYPRAEFDPASTKIVFHYDGDIRMDGSLSVASGAITLEDLVVTLPEGSALADVYFGLSRLPDDARDAVGDLDVPEWPDWRAFAVCVPGLDPSTATSIARRWDLGQTDVALGAFGPASGAPYGAAFPRPTYVSAFGDDDGWVLIGATDVPAAQSSLMVRATSFALRWSVRDDLWGPRSRVDLRAGIRILAAASPVDAFHRYVSTVDIPPRETRPAAFSSTSNTWGDFRRGDFDMDSQIALAEALGAAVLVIDDGWETEESSGIPDSARIGDLDEAVAKSRRRGVDVGFWQSVGWIRHPELHGLTTDDLIVGADGAPVRTNWALDPRDDAKFLIDPTTPGGRRFLLERTGRLVSAYRPALVKLDFGYAYPAVARAVPRDPSWRGERLSYELCRMLADHIRAVCPTTAVLGYTASPIHAAIFDVISMDDMGDAGFFREGENHRHWSAWGSALGLAGIPLSGSGGYNPDQDGEAVLNTAVLGGSGSMLASADQTGEQGPRHIARRRAIARWQRRSAHWRPLWLDSELGGVNRQPRVASWGRLEGHSDLESLTALALRPVSPGSDALARPAGFASTGAFAIIALGEGDLRNGQVRAAVIPVLAGELAMPWAASAARVTTFVTGEEPTTTTVVATAGGVTLTATETALDSGLEGWEVESA